MSTSAMASSHEIEPGRLRDSDSAASSPSRTSAPADSPPRSPHLPDADTWRAVQLPVTLLGTDFAAVVSLDDDDPIACLLADLRAADGAGAPSPRDAQHDGWRATATDGNASATTVRRSEAARAPLTSNATAPNNCVADGGESPAAARRGAVVASDEERPALLAGLARAGFVIANCSSAPTAGGLAAALDEAVEVALALRGAVPPTVHAESDALTIARDQLFRTRALGAKGLCVVVARLSALAAPAPGCGGLVLEARDAGALRLWSGLSATEPVLVLLDAADEAVRLPTPVPLRMALGAFDATPPVTEDTHVHVAIAGSQSHAAPNESGTRIPVDPDPRLAVRFSEPPPAAPEDDESKAGPEGPGPRPDAAAQERRPRGVLAPRRHRSDNSRAEESETPGGVAGSAAPPEAPPRSRSAASAKRSSVGFPLLDDSTADAFAAELEAAHGPRPVAMVEQLFIERYAPLCETVNAGGGTPSAKRAVARFRESFEHSYTEGFTAMRLTGKRPRMVLDAPDLASRIGRLNGARAVHLLLVDGMRFDLGEHCMRRLRVAMVERAACVERALLWSALPALTSVQLHLLGRGPNALREEDPPSERDYAVHRGRSATALRRVRIGQRDLVKLDVVEARLRDAGPALPERMAALADEVASSIARHAESLAPRTLLYVFGDHGFRIQTEAGATAPATQGGASPEEVLVPAYAWLTGEVH